MNRVRGVRRYRPATVGRRSLAGCLFLRREVVFVFGGVVCVFGVVQDWCGDLNRAGLLMQVLQEFVLGLRLSGSWSRVPGGMWCCWRWAAALLPSLAVVWIVALVTNARLVLSNSHSGVADVFGVSGCPLVPSAVVSGAIVYWRLPVVMSVSLWSVSIVMVRSIRVPVG